MTNASPSASANRIPAPARRMQDRSPKVSEDWCSGTSCDSIVVNAIPHGSSNRDPSHHVVRNVRGHTCSCTEIVSISRNEIVCAVLHTRRLRAIHGWIIPVADMCGNWSLHPMMRKPDQWMRPTRMEVASPRCCSWFMRFLHFPQCTGHSSSESPMRFMCGFIRMGYGLFPRRATSSKAVHLHDSSPANPLGCHSEQCPRRCGGSC